MKKLLLIVATGATLTAQAQRFNYNANGKVKVFGENTHLAITPVPASYQPVQQAAGAAITALVGPVVDLGISVAKTINKAAVKKFEGTYKANSSGSGFYQNNTTVNLPKLVITRDIVLGNSAPTNAATITLEPELSADQRSFRYRLSDLNYLYSIAKTKRDWDYINVTIELKFKSLSINKGQYEVKDLKGTNVIIPLVHVGGPNAVDVTKPIYSGWIPFPQATISEQTVANKPSTESQEETTAKTDIDGKTTTEVIAVTTKKKKDTKEESVNTTNAGMYEIECTVVETNPFKITAENRQQLVENSGDKAGDLLKAALGLLKKEDEDKKEDK